jgi:predicted dehydrogenase
MDEPVRLAIVGAGNRGRFAYGAWCRHRPDLAQVVAIAEPDPIRRDAMADEHGVSPARAHAGWQALLGDLADVDGVVIATLDHEHIAPAAAFLDAGADIVLEKPIAPDREGIEEVRAAARRSEGTVTIAHVLRYTPMFGTLKRLLDEDAIGELRGIDHAEHVGLRLFTHAYVRGNWRREDTSSPVILSKSCHDLDLIRWWADAPWTAASSWGELTYFNEAHAPEGAPTHCLHGCPVEDTCPFHAGRRYIDNTPDPEGYPTNVITSDPSLESRLAALRDGPYGRCVFRSDNDVPDHQTAMFRFANGVQASFTLTAFAAKGARHTRLFGTRGDITGDPLNGTITIRRYQPAPHVERPSGADGGPRVMRSDDADAAARSFVNTEIVEARPEPDAFPGHGGGDDGLMQAFVTRLQARRDPAPRPDRLTSALTSLDASLESHEMAFAAERSRHSGRIVGPDLH